MSVFFRRREQADEARSVRLPPDLVATAPATYADVNLTAVETSMQVVAVRSAVDLFASLASELPIDVYSGQGGDRRSWPLPGYLRDPAGDGQGLADWVYQVMLSWLLRGNVYGEVLDRSATGYPTQVTLFHPDEVGGWIDSDGNVHWTLAGRQIPTDRVLHRRVNPVPGRIQGLSPIAFHAADLGLSLTTTQYGLQFFRDGAHPGGMLTNTEVALTPELAQTAKQRFLSALRGTREPVVMGKGWKYEQIQIAPEESQFLETRGYSAAECCRIFGPGVAETLGYETGGSLTYTNRVDRSADLLQLALDKWLRRLERLLSSMLPEPRYARVNRDALLRMNTLDRYRAHEIALRNEWKVVNEVRDDEDMPPVSWGDEPRPKTAGQPANQPPASGGN